jgi:predicted nucleic acid-binding Zn ribbon protein
MDENARSRVLNTLMEIEGFSMNYKKIYDSIIVNGKMKKLYGYTEEHHIMPKCLGGTNAKSNLVHLTAKEHFMCHLLLTKMYPKGSDEYYKMCHAFLMMLVSSKNQNRHITAKKYETLKEGHSKRMSELQSGKGNSQYGTMWINNPTSKECKKVPSDSVIEEGWLRGRVIIWDKPTVATIESDLGEKLNHRKYPICEKTCVICSNTFKGKSGKKYCSDECKKKLNHRKYPIYEKTCVICSNTFKGKSGKKYCSDECRFSIVTNELDKHKTDFLLFYKNTCSINKSLQLLGKCGAGGYYDWAKKVITTCNDDEVLMVYRKNMK